MNTIQKSVLAAAALVLSAQAAAQVTFYEREGFLGRSFTTATQVGNFERFGFNERASSVVVIGDRWEVCEDSRFDGRCVVLRPGRYPSLATMGLNDSASSARIVPRDARVADDRYAPAPATAAPQVIFYEGENFQGRSFTTEQAVGNFRRFGFNDSASSVEVVGDQWEVCENARFGGRCAVLRPGRYPTLSAMGLNDRVSSVRMMDSSADSRRAPVTSQVTFYEGENFQGRSFTSEQAVENFRSIGFNDRASSIEVTGNQWLVCENAQYDGRCAVLRPGKYPSLIAMGMNDRISSMRLADRDERVEDNRRGPNGTPAYDARRRGDERLFEATVTSVRAVVGTPEQRCWVEPGQVSQERGGLNIPGAIAGAVIGGILGHQIGNGRGSDIATVGGAVAGGAVGANVGRGSQQAATQDVRRCENVSSQAQPELWDVTYSFRGQEHRIQMTSPPGATVTVNAQGEPRAS